MTQLTDPPSEAILSALEDRLARLRRKIVHLRNERNSMAARRRAAHRARCRSGERAKLAIGNQMHGLHKREAGLVNEILRIKETATP